MKRGGGIRESEIQDRVRYKDNMSQNYQIAVLESFIRKLTPKFEYESTKQHVPSTCHTLLFPFKDAL